MLCGICAADKIGWMVVGSQGSLSDPVGCKFILLSVIVLSVILYEAASEPVSTFSAFQTADDQRDRLPRILSSSKRIIVTILSSRLR